MSGYINYTRLANFLSHFGKGEVISNLRRERYVCEHMCIFYVSNMCLYHDI